METLAYLHLAENFESPENKDLNCNLSGAASKAAIGLAGVACAVSALGTSQAAFACSYHSEHDSHDYYSYAPESEYSQSCGGCGQYEQSYYPDYSYEQSYYPDYSHDYYSYDSYYSPVEHYQGTNIVSPGASGPLIATLQAALADQGYYAGPIDGVYGPGTVDAVAQYQIEAGLAVDGVAGGQTLASLGLAV